MPGEADPLLRLCVLHRLKHRWVEESGAKLSEAQEARFRELIAKAEGDVKRHFERFAEIVEEKIQEALAETEGDE